MVQALRRDPPRCLDTSAILGTGLFPARLGFPTAHTFVSRFRVWKIPTPFVPWSTKPENARFRFTEPPKAAGRCYSPTTTSRRWPALERTRELRSVSLLDRAKSSAWAAPFAARMDSYCRADFVDTTSCATPLRTSNGQSTPASEAF